MDNIQQITSWAVPAGLILGGFLLGLLIDKIFLARLNFFATRTRWNGDEIVLDAIRKQVTVWFTLIGVYASISRLPVGADIQNWLQKLLLVLVIFLVTVTVGRIVTGLVTLYTNRVEGLSTSIFINLSRILVFILGFLIILQSLSISITPILTALGVGGLAVALALQDTLANLFAGLQIIASNQIRPGDFIRIESGEEGYVADISWRNTSIRTLSNNMIIIPNSKMASSIITNSHQPDKETAVVTEAGVSYSSDLKKVERVTIEVAKEVLQEVEGGIAEFEPFIRYNSFADSSINFRIIMRAREFTDQFLLRHELVKRLQERYIKEGIEIPFPIRTLYIKGGTEQRATDGFHYQESSGHDQQEVTIGKDSQ